MSEPFLARGVEDVASLKLIARKHGLPLELVPEFPLRDPAPQVVRDEEEIPESFRAAAAQSPAETVSVRRLYD